MRANPGAGVRAPLCVRLMFGLGLSRYLPGALRPLVIGAVTRSRRVVMDMTSAGDLRDKRKAVPRRYSGERVALLGFAESPTGLGRGVRLMQMQFAHEGVTSETFDVMPLLLGDRRYAAAFQERLEAFAPTDVVIHANPPALRDTAHRLPRAQVLECAIVGYWAWELERLPDSWAADARLLDAIWAPSAFVANAVRTSLPDFAGEVRVVPHATFLDPIPRVTPERRAAARATFGVAEDAFVAGYAFTTASNFARKNPIAAIDAFQRAFPDAGGTSVLLLRCPDLDDYPRGKAQLIARIGSDTRVRILDRAAAPIPGFYDALDVFLSLHRSEGYGLQIVEAMQAGVPAIATAWGLDASITRQPRFHGVSSRLVAVNDPQRLYQRVRDARWAEPDIDEAAKLLTQLRER
jgi:glycosyltransferase involved in cell wall biosynthesis